MRECDTGCQVCNGWSSKWRKENVLSGSLLICCRIYWAPTTNYMLPTMQNAKWDTSLTQGVTSFPKHTGGKKRAYKSKSQGQRWRAWSREVEGRWQNPAISDKGLWSPGVHARRDLRLFHFSVPLHRLSLEPEESSQVLEPSRCCPIS